MKARKGLSDDRWHKLNTRVPGGFDLTCESGRAAAADYELEQRKKEIENPGYRRPGPGPRITDFWRNYNGRSS